MSDEVFERFQKCAVEVLSVDAGQVTKEASFADDLEAETVSKATADEGGVLCCRTR